MVIGVANRRSTSVLRSFATASGDGSYITPFGAQPPALAPEPANAAAPAIAATAGALPFPWWWLLVALAVLLLLSDRKHNGRRRA